MLHITIKIGAELMLTCHSFAWAEMRMIAANIFSRFDVAEVSGQHIDFRQYITMQFASGHWKAVLVPRTMSVNTD